MYIQYNYNNIKYIITIDICTYNIIIIDICTYNIITTI